MVGPPAVTVGTGGAGFTVTSTVVAELEQPPLLAVMVYLTTSAVLEVLMRVWEITGPVPEPNPVVTDPVSKIASQVKTVPKILLDREMLVVPPVQIACEAGSAVTAIT